MYAQDVTDNFPFLQARREILRERKAQILAPLNDADQSLAFKLRAKAAANGFDFG